MLTWPLCESAEAAVAPAASLVCTRLAHQQGLWSSGEYPIRAMRVHVIRAHVCMARDQRHGGASDADTFAWLMMKAWKEAV